jgi:hypothetical protein
MRRRRPRRDRTCAPATRTTAVQTCATPVRPSIHRPWNAPSAVVASPAVWPGDADFHVLAVLLSVARAALHNFVHVTD